LVNRYVSTTPIAALVGDVEPLPHWAGQGVRLVTLETSAAIVESLVTDDASILGDEMAGDIDPAGIRKDGLDAFLDEKLAEGFTIETRTNTHAIIFRRPKGLRRFAGGHDPGRFVVEVDEHGRVTMSEAEPRRS
jgi:hypothetical protein